MESLKKLDRIVRKVLEIISLVLFAALGLLLIVNVFLRLMGDLTQFFHTRGLDGVGKVISTILPVTSFHWLDEIVELCFAGLIFYGAAALWVIKGHFSVGDWISKRLPGDKSRAFYKALITLFSVVFLAIFFVFAVRLTAGATELSTVFQIPKKVMYSCMPVSSLIMLCYSVAELVSDLKGFAKTDSKKASPAA
jgi:TRAP-type C4-dicarboxylate transport system permease small subunit